MIGQFRTLPRVLALGAIVSLSSRNQQMTFCEDLNNNAVIPSWPFDAKGFPIKAEAEVGKGATYLVGVGMRRKRIVIADFDIYLIGIRLSKDSILKATKWCNTPESDRIPISQYVLSKPVVVPVTTPASKGTKVIPSPPPTPTVVAACNLRMIRGVGRDVFVQAFRDAFVGVSSDAFAEFNVILERCLGPNGAGTGDNVTFLWISNGDLVMIKNGVVAGIVNNDEISYRLLDVYCDPKRAVSNELIHSLNENVSKVVQLITSNNQLE